MKKILQTTAILTFIFLSLNVNAKTRLSVNTTMPTAMKVVIDGRKFYSQDNSICINNLQPGYHDIAIYFIKNGRDFNSYYNYGNNGYWKKAISRQVVVRNNYQYDITINRFGKAFFDQDYYNVGYYRGDDANNEEDDDDDNAINYDYNNNGYDENYDDLDYFRKKGGNTQMQSFPPVHSNNNYNNSYSNNNVMSGQKFNQIKQTIQQQDFESSKLDFAKQSLDKNVITTNQAKEMIGLLAMETSKLDFAKHAYDKVSDKNNYFTVVNSLAMQTSKDDLLKYIRNRK